MKTIHIHNTAMVANTPFFTATAGENLPSSTFRCYIVLTATTSPVVTVRRTNTAGGGGTVSEGMNSKSGIVSGAAYMFDVLVTDGDTLTVQSDQNGNVDTFILREVAQ